ncbi:sensor histidine kinase [Methanoculleus methanifontis]|nr:sensor histidine kinase [Methanoculleus sp. FWC-SCC3]
MEQLELLRRTLRPLLERLPAEEQKEVVAALAGMESGIASLTAGYDHIQRYRTVFENTSTAVVALKADCTINLANTQFEQLAGYPKSEIEGKKRWTEFVVSEDLARMREQHLLRREREESAQTQYEFRFLSRTGEIHDIFANIDMVPGTRESIAFLFDITEQKKTEEIIRQTEAQLTNAMDIAQLVEWEEDVESQTFTFNDQFYSLYGTTAAREGGNVMPMERYAREFVHPDDLQVIAEVMARTTEGTVPEVQQVEHRIIRKDGTIRHIIARIKCVKDANGKPVRVYGANQDITERKRMEEALQKKNAELQTIIDNIPDLAWLTDTDSRFIAVNRKFSEVVEVNPENLIGNTCDLCFGRRAAEIFEEENRKVMASKEQAVAEESFINVGQSGSIFETIRSPILDRSGEVIGTVGIARDITGRKKTEEAVRLANKKLNLLSSITRHDVLNQLTVVLGYLRLAEEQVTDPLLRDYLEKMSKAGEIARRQIEFTREYQEIGVRLPRWQDVRSTILQATKDLTPGLVTLSVDIRDVEVFADPLLEKVFYNTVENALRHGGSITKVKFSAENSDGCLRIVCEDDGTGVPESEKQHIFERRYFNHTGFGLFLAKEVLAITGLSIRETGVPGEGARFELLVPAGVYRLNGQQS